ncbi:NAD(P)-dependent oxidoreductase [Paracoccaceae bacterium Fryx2]|nr:NAD(P)-dependent oxidoreductase [Paracoccaceae bacterium Fryx2]
MTGGAIRDRRLLVTGAAGFLGGALCRRAVAQGALVTALLHVAGPAPDGVAGVDVLDLATGDIDAVLARAEPQAIVHCAGLTAAPGDAAGHALLLRANVTATERLLQAAARQALPPRVVLVSSAAIWGPMAQGQAAIDESHPIAPASPYGHAKAAMTRLGLEAGEAGLQVAIGVPFNIIGPGQPARMAPQAFIDQLRADPAVITLSDPDAVRDWVDVRDVAEALLRLADPATPPALYNIATGRGLSLGAMVQAIGEVTGRRPEIRRGSAPAGVSRSIGNPGRLLRATGWQAQVPLVQTLADMLAG